MSTTHAPGACHFCGQTDGAVYLRSYGVSYCGCEGGMGILRIWSMNGIRWGDRPSEVCACTKAVNETTSTGTLERRPMTDAEIEEARENLAAALDAACADQAAGRGRFAPDAAPPPTGGIAYWTGEEGIL